MAEYIKFNKNVDTDYLVLEHWLVNEGAHLNQDQQVASVRANNRIFLLRSPIEGILIEKLVEENEPFAKDVEIGKVVTKQEAGERTVNDTLSKKDRKILESFNSSRNPSKVRKVIHLKASPSARRKAKAENINLEEIIGTGPNGRIQLRDVNDYIKSHRIEYVAPKVYKNKEVQYGLPFTSLAKRLAKANDLDLSKIPAPPNARKVKVRDVERYLHNPVGAAQEIENEYNVRLLSDLKNPLTTSNNILPASITASIDTQEEPEPSVIRLPSEEPNIAKSNDVIELDHNEVKRIALGNPISELLLSEPEPLSDSVIRMSSEEDNIIPTGMVILLDYDDSNEPLLLEATPIIQISAPEISEEAQEEPISVIRLTTEEENYDRNDNVISLPQTSKVDVVSERLDALKTSIEELKEIVTEEAEKVESNIAHLSTYVDLDLVKLVKKYNPPVKEIGLFSKNYILSAIYKVFNEIKKDQKAYYISDLKNDVISYYNSDYLNDVKKQVVENLTSRNNVKINKDDLIIIELLAYNLNNVSGLINPKDHIVLYLSYIKDFGRFYREQPNIKSILELSIDFDTKVLSPVDGINFIEKLREELESQEVEY